MTIRSPTPRAISQAAAALRAGELVAFPTETVYGLGADATNALAVAKIFAAKGRPRFNPLIAHVADLKAAEAIAVFDHLALKIAKRFWPGPLTLVLPMRAEAGICDLVTAGLATFAIRVPAHPIAHALLEAAGRPIAAPSANRSGHVSATMAAHVAADLGDAVTMILDGGSSEIGLESTILACQSGRLQVLRPGAVTREQIEAELGQPIDSAASSGASNGERPNAPGQLASHYAPAATIRLDADRPRSGEALLAFGPAVPNHDGPCFNLSASGDLLEAAINLFAALRALDATGARVIAVMPVPRLGLGEAINDRLQRAAAPRPERIAT